MKVLVTGGAGYIGGVVTHALVEAGHQVVVLDDLSTGFADNIPAGVPFHQLSVHRVAEVLTPDAGFEGVLHFAGKIEVAESVARPDLYWDVNVVGTIAVLNAIRAAGTPRLIFSSTGSMYDSAVTVGKLSEDAPVRPVNPYAATKYAVDLMLAGECGAFGLGAASLRYFNASGAVGKLGERHTPESHLIPIVLDVAAGRRGELMLYGDDYPTPDGTCIRDYIHVADLATAHLLALEAIKPGSHRDLQPRERRRLQQPPGHRGGPRGHRPAGPGQAGAPAPRRRRRHRGRQRQGPPRARLAPRPSRPARHHRRRLVLPPVRLVAGDDRQTASRRAVGARSGARGRRVGLAAEQARLRTLPGLAGTATAGGSATPISSSSSRRR